MIPDLTIVETAALPARAAHKIADLLRTAAETNGRACLALAGGTTPRAVHEALAALPALPWHAVHVYFGDERCVAPDHPDSNYRMAKESLFDRVPLPSANIHRPRAEADDRDAAAREYEALLPDALDVVVLGIGEDGHTASLFPGSPALNERTRRYIPVVGPKPPPNRLTLTVSALERARQLVMLALGSGKAAAVARALEGPLDLAATPSQLARRGTWFVDPPAARSLTRLAPSPPVHASTPARPLVLDEARVRELAREMIEAWNSHDLARILAHYEEDVVLTSPVAAERLGDPSGTVRGKAALRAYFEVALAAYPELHFELVDVLWGLGSVVLYYVNQRGSMTAEVMELSPAGRVARVLANYGTRGRPG